MDEGRPPRSLSRSADTGAVLPVTPAQKRVLVALCAPYTQHSTFTKPATNREIAGTLVLSVEAVKSHLRVLYAKFGLEELPQNEKRLRLAELALVHGLVDDADSYSDPLRSAEAQVGGSSVTPGTLEYGTRVILTEVWSIRVVAEAAPEREAIPAKERVAIDRAIEKLAVLGSRLPFPHQSAVRGPVDLRELRPRAGRSPWRAFYRRIGEVIVIGGFGPEAQSDPRGFERAVARAESRLNEYE